MMYNKEGTFVHEMAKELKRKFEDDLKKSSIDLIVLKEGHTIADAIQNFDIDICKCSWDGLGS
jgi:hypothetical protein